MGTLLVVLHVIIGIFLICVVMLQSGKAGSIADVFGGGGSMAAFGARGAATLLVRITTVAAILFLITSLALTMIKTTEESIMTDAPTKQEAPQAPSTPTPNP